MLVVLLAALTVVFIGLLVLLWFRLVRDTVRPGPRRRWATAALVGLTLTPIAADIGRQDLPWTLQRPLDLVGFGWLGYLLYLLLAVVVLEPVRLVLLQVIRRAERSRRVMPGTATPVFERPPPTGNGDKGSPIGSDDALATAPERMVEDLDVPRRLFLARSLAVTAGAVALGTSGYGVWAAGAAPVVRTVPVAIPGLAPQLAGYRIVTFSDAHLSSLYGERRFQRLVDLVNAQEPDAVAIVGDLVDGGVDDLRQDIAPIGDLVSRDGAFFVTGNHEYYVDTQAWMRHLPTLGVQVLRNERVAIRRDGRTFDLVGIDDRTAAASGVRGHGADLDAALDGRDDSTPTVLLAHQPVQVEQAQAAGIDLQLSGHTHGGQLWPFSYVVGLEQPAVQGLSRHGDTQLYVTAGIGYWGPPMRVGARPEITVIELTPG